MGSVQVGVVHHRVRGSKEQNGCRCCEGLVSNVGHGGWTNWIVAINGANSDINFNKNILV